MTRVTFKIQYITLKRIIKEAKLIPKIVSGLIFSIAGILLTIMPLIYLRVIDFNSMMGVFTCFICFGIPFGIILGYKNLLPELKKYKSLKKGNFIIILDTIVDMRILNSGIESDNSDHYCQAKLKYWSKNTGKYYTISRRFLDKARIGDGVYLVLYDDDVKNIISVFLEKEYALVPSEKLHYIGNYNDICKQTKGESL